MAKNKKTDTKGKNIAVGRYGWIVFVLFVVFAAIIFNIFKIKYVEGSMWRALGKKQTEKNAKEILPNRGNIYSDDGRLLATSQPLYGIYMDFMADGIQKDTLMKYVTPLSQALAKKFPYMNMTAAQYNKRIMDGWHLSRKELAQIAENKRTGSNKRVATRSRYVRILPQDISYLDLKEIRTYPFLKLRTNKNGLITEEKTERLKPFGNLAGRTVGSIYKGVEMGGTSGLELQFDSILKGVPGIQTRQRVEGRWINVTELEPKAGWDIQTTLNIEIQDITERALYEKLNETEAEAGWAVIMEVESGEIKAIANLERNSNGSYTEGKPSIFSYMGEPGSTFKTISVLVALDDNVVTPDEEFFVGDGLLQYKDRTVRDHYWRKGMRKEYMSVTDGMNISSNVVMSKMVLKGYEKNPRKFAEGIERIGLMRNLEWDMPLQGIEGTTFIRFPEHKANPWSATTLPWMSFGYETQIPPIYLLMFYNGIANNGRMIKPFITKEFSQDGKREERFKAEVINPSIASKRSIKQVQDMLRSVITDGTGAPVASEMFPISGKTGTALIAHNGRYDGSEYVSFCGYFPSDKPKYTAFVGIRRPKLGYASGGGMPGVVFKNIAESVYYKDMAENPIVAPIDSVHPLIPQVKNGYYDDAKYVLDKLSQSYKSPSEKTDWITTRTIDGRLVLDVSSRVERGLVPNVVGMGARDAIYLLENAGLTVNLIGSGRVTSQSIPTGTKFTRGTTITIQLK